MAIHKINLSQDSLIGSFTSEVTPIITISSGDSIRFNTLDAGWGRGTNNKERKKPFTRREKIDGGHALVGPIFIQNARKGMVLEVVFNEIIPGSYGFTAAGQYPNWQNKMLHLTQYQEISLDWKLDHKQMEGMCEIGGKTYTVPLKPFMGVVGMPPAETGVH